MNYTSLCKSLVIVGKNTKQCGILSDNNELYCTNHIHKNRFFATLCECCICTENIDKTVEVPLECGHIFHKICFMRYNKDVCPLCKSQLTLTEINYYKQDVIIHINTNTNSININIVNDANNNINNNNGSRNVENSAPCAPNRHPVFAACMIAFYLLSIIGLIIGLSNR